MNSKLQEVVCSVIDGRESAYADSHTLCIEMARLINYAISNRDPRPIHTDEEQTAQLVAKAVRDLGYELDTYIGRDLWELVSEDSQAQWLESPDSVEGVYVSLVNVANNMAQGQCRIEFI